MLHCPRCNLPYPENHRFCKACGCTLILAAPGLEVLFTCPNCEAPIQSGWRFCKKCRCEITAPRAATPATAASATVTCSGCGYVNPLGSRFCETCGSSLNGLRSTATPEPLATSYALEEDVALDDSDGGIFASLTERNTDNILLRNLFGLSVAAGVVCLVAIIMGGYFLYVRSKQAPVTQASPAPTPVRPATPAPPENMAYVAGGTFRMGRDDGDEYERPSHVVTVSPFFIDKFEVTCAAYQKFMDARGFAAPQNWPNGRMPAGGEQLPVTGVSWVDANAYAEWAGKRLPTEEEWEFAARGQDATLYPWGNTWKGDAANTLEASQKRVVAVGSFSQGASPYGAFDMTGNAWEWTSTQLAAYPGGHISDQNSQAGQQLMVIRGGSYESNNKQATTTYRMGWPAQGATTYAQSGFRCVKDIDKQ